MKKTKICQILGIEYPIIQASMAWSTDANLVAAVSNAGAMGTIGPNAGVKTISRDVYETGERLREQIKGVKRLSNKPFAVNFPIGLGGNRKFSDRCVEIGIEEKVPVAIVSEGNPKEYTQKLKKAGMKVIHVIHTPEHAMKAEAAGVDAIITSGTEGGGHSGFQRLATFATLPQIVDTVRLPVIAGGGIGDARGLVAALALGAEGVYMGTRFIATQECPAHPNVKQKILDADTLSTISLGHDPGRIQARPEAKEPSSSQEFRFFEQVRGSLRMIECEFTTHFFELENQGIDDSEVQTFLNSPAPGPGNRSRPMASFIDGEVENGVAAGQEVGLINDIPTCQQLVERIIKEAGRIMEQLGAMA